MDNFIHYAPRILHRVDIGGIWGPACFLYKIWQVFLHHAWAGGVRTTIAKHHGRYSKPDHLCQDGVE